MYGFVPVCYKGLLSKQCSQVAKCGPTQALSRFTGSVNGLRKGPFLFGCPDKPTGGFPDKTGLLEGIVGLSGCLINREHRFSSISKLGSQFPEWTSRNEY